MKNTNFNNELSINSLPDHNYLAACSAWLQTRYMKSERDVDFLDALSEILQTDGQGALTYEGADARVERRGAYFDGSARTSGIDLKGQRNQPTYQ